jgi:hypothetical protein
MLDRLLRANLEPLLQAIIEHFNVELLGVVDGVAFQWITWWNSYTLFVLLRRKPMLSLVGGILRP